MLVSVLFVIVRNACGILTSFVLPLWKLFLTKKGCSSSHHWMKRLLSLYYEKA